MDTIILSVFCVCLYFPYLDSLVVEVGDNLIWELLNNLPTFCRYVYLYLFCCCYYYLHEASAISPNPAFLFFSTTTPLCFELPLCTVLILFDNLDASASCRALLLEDEEENNGFGSFCYLNYFGILFVKWTICSDLCMFQLCF